MTSALPHSIDTKDSALVWDVVEATFVRMGFAQSTRVIARLFRDVVRMFEGEYRGYFGIDVCYHDLEHTLQAAVCLAKILDGRQLALAQPRLTRRDCVLALAAILLHDTGYLRQHWDTTATGAKYSLVQEQRSADFARAYLPTLGFCPAEIDDVAAAILCTGRNNHVARTVFASPEARAIATIVVTADYLGQMASDDYVDKLPYLYYELEEAFRFENIPLDERPFRSVRDLLEQTPAFWEGFVHPMLDCELDGVYRFLASETPDANPYIVAIERNIARARALVTAPEVSLEPFAHSGPRAKRKIHHSAGRF